MRLLKSFFVVCVLTLLINGASARNHHGENAVLSRDDLGIWRIKTHDRYEAFQKMGLAIAEDRLWQLEMFRRASRGRLAEIFGSDFVELDVFMRTIGYSEEEMRNAFDELDEESKVVISAYVDGINARIEQIGQEESRLPIEFKLMGLFPARWSETDILAFLVYMLRTFDGEALYNSELENAKIFQELAAKFPENYLEMFSDLRWLNDPKSQTMIPAKTYERPRREQHRPEFRGRIAPNCVSSGKIWKRNIKKLKRVNAYVKMGSYAWVLSGRKTASGNPIIYSGPQMGFSVPTIVSEGSIQTCGYNVSGMTIPGVPAIIIGRSPTHAWSMQVGHAHSVDYYIEDASAVSLHRFETIKVAGGEDIDLPVYRTSHGPLVNPIPYNPLDNTETLVAWKYSHWGYELRDGVKALIGLGAADNIREFGNVVEELPVSLHLCYADKRGNIAYWMSGRDPMRPEGVDIRFPKLGDGTQEWLDTLVERPFAVNPRQGYFAGWNNKAVADYDNCNISDYFFFGPFHRAHVMEDYFSSHDQLSFEQIRDFAINVATTDSFASGGNPWRAVSDYFVQAVMMNEPTTERLEALALFDDWNGHFIDGGQSEWVSSMTRSDAWTLQNKWILKVLELTFYDELDTTTMTGADHHPGILFGMLLHALENDPDGVVNQYDWFQNTNGTGPSTVDEIIVTALDRVLVELGNRPWNVARGTITFSHDLLGELTATPFGQRSTYAQCVEMGRRGPVRIETMFSLGESGNIGGDLIIGPQFDENFFSMQELFNGFTHKTFPLFGDCRDGQ